MVKWDSDSGPLSRGGSLMRRARVFFFYLPPPSSLLPAAPPTPAFPSFPFARAGAAISARLWPGGGRDLEV